MKLKAGRPSRAKSMEQLKADLRGETATKVRLNVNMDDTLYWELKKKALNDRTTVTDVIIRLVQGYVNDS